MRESELDEVKSRRSLLGAIIVTFIALLVVSVPVFGHERSHQRDGFAGRLNDFKRHNKWWRVARAVRLGVKWAKRVRFWLPIVIAVITWRSKLKHATSRGAQSTD